MLRLISENIQFEGEPFKGINFSSSTKRLQLSTLAQWQLSDSAPKDRPKTATTEIRYPTRLPMELPWSISSTVNPGILDLKEYKT